MGNRSLRGHLLALLAAAFVATSGVAGAQSVNRTYSCALGGAPWAGTSTGSFQEACSNAAASAPLVDGPTCTPASQGVTGSYNGQCDLFSTAETTCSNGAVRPSGSGVGALNCSVSYSCSGGYVYVNGACVPPAGSGADDCGRTKGVRPSGDLCAVLPPSGYTMQHNGCVYEMGGEGEMYTLTEGSQAGQTMWCGGWLGTGSPVGSSSPNVGVSRPGGGSTGGTSTTTDPNRTGQTGGGTSQPNQGFNATDAANLARIATNTGTTVKAVDAMNQSLGAKIDAVRGAIASGGSGGGGGGGSTTVNVPCGGPGQIACAEDGAGASNAAQGVADAIESHEVQSNAGLLNSPPDVGASGRWLLNLATFRGNYVAQCSHSWTVQLPLIGEQHFELDFCPWAQYVKTFLYWAFGIWTAYALWSTVYSSQRKA